MLNCYQDKLSFPKTHTFTNNYTSYILSQVKQIYNSEYLQKSYFFQSLINIVLVMFMEFLENLISGTLPFVFLIICGIYLSFKTNFCQITGFMGSIKLTAKAFLKREKTKEITSYKSACTAISATVGTGNIAGVAGAISIGGAGAVFWMWISAILGMCIKSAEITLAVIYREKNESGFVGGPQYYIKNGLGKAFKPLGFVFCLAAIPAVIVGGNMTQANSAIITVSAKPAERLILGFIFAFLCFLASGSISKITAVTEKIVPLMSVLYIIICVVVLWRNTEVLPGCFKMILIGAFRPKAVTGGAVGSIFSCMFIGASRGIFSNEAGLGTSAMAHSVAVDADPKTQGLYGIFEVFVDTILLCTLTALTILTSSVKINFGEPASAELVLDVLKTEFGDFGGICFSLMMCLFAFSSIIGWAVYGRLTVGYLLGEKGVKVFGIIYPVCSVLGAVFTPDKVWRMAGFFNGIMLCTNLTAILLLSGKAEIYLKRGKQIENKRTAKNIKQRRLCYNTKPR